MARDDSFISMIERWLVYYLLSIFPFFSFLYFIFNNNIIITIIQQDKTPKAVVSLERAAVGSPSNVAGLEEEYCFSLHTPQREYMFVAESNAEMMAWQQALNENIKEKIDDALSQIAAAAARAEYDEKQRRKAEQEKASQDKKEQKVAEQARKVQSKEDARCRQAIDETVKLRSQLVALDSDCNSVESRFVELTRHVEKSIAAIDVLARTVEPLSPTTELLQK